jgi:hypothetical protein
VGLLDSIKKWLASSFLTNLLRHGLTALGASLIAWGLPADIVLPWQEMTLQLCIQALPLVIALIWSLLEKKYLKAAMPMK